MQLPLRVPILPAQCYPPPADFMVENCHNGGARQPLGESTGNAQLNGFGRLYNHRPSPLASMAPSMLTPPIVPTQSLSSGYGPSVYAKQYEHHQLQLHARRRRSDINPLWLYCQPFQTYRKKQDEKDDKTGQKWPQVLEDAFLDGLLLIPHIGRKKYTVRGKLYGRNMLLGEYLWLSYSASCPEPDPNMLRGRKQVSSHIQVLKNIFKHHRCCHVFLPKEVKKSKEAATDEVDSVSLKKHPVLVALSEGRLPEEKANYEYFARILALNNHIAVRPKRCWIFVGHQDVKMRDDGSGYLPETGEGLGRDDYPHIERNLEREKWSKEEQQNFRGVILHEFTKDFGQVESCALRELSSEWKRTSPEFHQRLENMMAINAQKDIVAAESQCDIMHMHVMLEVNENRHFPSQSELNSWVEVTVEKLHLLNHRWKVQTRLSRPAELCNGSKPKTMYETEADITIQEQHRPDCDSQLNARGSCHCLSQHGRRDCVLVPFPAEVFADVLSKCVEYPAHPLVGSARRRAKRARVGGTKEESDGSPAMAADEHLPTQMDLVPRITMMQELWSCAPGDVDKPQGGKQWTRRSMILWTFKTIHSLDYKDKGRPKLVTAEGGKTTWRFLTVLDPISEYHLQNSVIPSGHASHASSYGDEIIHGLPLAGGLPAGVGSRDAIMSPSPTYQQHLSASMSENFSAAWDTANGLGAVPNPVQAYDAHLLGQTAPPPAPSHATGYSLLGSFGSHGGLATPPPTACLTSSFSHSFDTASSGASHVPSYATVGVTGAEMASGSQVPSDSIPSVTDPYLSGDGSSSFHGVAYNGSNGGIASWDGDGVADMNANSWHGYVPASAGAHSAEDGLGWERAVQGSGGHHNYQCKQEHQQQQPQWAHSASSRSGEELRHWNANHPAASTTVTGSEHWGPSSNGSSPSAVAAHYDRGGSQEWEQVAQSSADGTGSDISQNWEEPDTSTASASDLSAGELQSQPQQRQHHPAEIKDLQRPIPSEGNHNPSLRTKSPHGLKRRRSDSLDQLIHEHFPAASIPRLG
ncbi:hypothetical protein OQA88_3938 [Cercophora sp. LCS_1]